MTPDHKPRLLIVDDVPTNIKVLSEFFGDCAVCFATNGRDALEIAASDPPPDLILLDVMMPGMSGYEVCRALKSEEATREIPVIFITSKDEEEDEIVGFEAGAVDYITKPFRMPIVMARVHTQLELKRSRDILAQLSRTDGLTRISNRKRFDEFLEAEWSRAGRSGRPIALVLVDIDFFKRYNDHYGHPKGDECLIKVACTLADSTNRPTDLVARYGGEEFGAVLPDTDQAGGLHVAESMRKNVKRLGLPHAASEVSDHVTISVGVTCAVPRAGDPCRMLVERADRALYLAKSASRDTCRCFGAEELRLAPPAE